MTTILKIEFYIPSEKARNIIFTNKSNLCRHDEILVIKDKPYELNFNIKNSSNYL